MKTKSIFNKISILLCCTILAALIVVSCKKDYQSENQPSKQELSKLAQWYQNNLKVSDDNPFSKFKPNWTEVYVRQQGPHNVYEISLGNQEKLVVSTSGGKRKLEELAENTAVHLLIFEERASNKILYASYMNVQASSGQALDKLHYKDVGNFTGTILYYHFSGNLSNGWNYLNGKITERITSITEQQFNQAQKQSQSGKKTDAMVCKSGFADKYQWQCVGVPGYLNCGFNYVGKEYVTVCAWQESGETIDHIAPDDSGGYLPPIFIDCAGVENGKATWSNNCNMCIGGSTGIEACPLELKTDSLKKKFPCADTLILQSILKSPIMSKFVEPFLTPQRPTVTYLTDNTLPWGSATTGGIFMLGNNNRDPHSGSGQSSIVRLNEKMLQNSSQLLIAATVVHETLHAYIKYNMAMANYNYSYYDDSNWMAGLNNFYLMVNLPPNYSNHTMMLEDYFDKSMGVLQAWNSKQGFIYSTKDMAMAMLYGLDAYDASTSQTQINTINAAFQAVKTKYNISTSDLTTFNNANLFSSTNKLPTTGCN